MFNKEIYNELLATYVAQIFRQEDHPLSNSAKRDTRIAKAMLDTYITDNIDNSNTTKCIADDFEPIHIFFRD